MHVRMAAARGRTAAGLQPNPPVLMTAEDSGLYACARVRMCVYAYADIVSTQGVCVYADTLRLLKPWRCGVWTNHQCNQRAKIDKAPQTPETPKVCNTCHGTQKPPSLSCKGCLHALHLKKPSSRCTLMF